MKISWNLVFQAVALVAQYGNQASAYVPPKAKTCLALVIGLAQAVVAWRQAYSNPDGTPASVAYKK
jgi:hypothetical protein